MQETAEKEPNQEISKAPTGLRDNIKNTYIRASQEGLDVVEVKKEDAGKEAEPVMEEGEIKLNQSIESEDFDQWLTH